MIRIYLECQQYELAIDEIDELLSLETWYSVNDLKLDRVVDPIRDNPRFKELMQRYALNQPGT